MFGRLLESFLLNITTTLYKEVKSEERKIPEVINEPLFAANNVCDVDKVKAALSDPTKITIVQCAPAVRIALGEEFGMDLGSLTPGN